VTRAGGGRGGSPEFSRSDWRQNQNPRRLFDDFLCGEQQSGRNLQPKRRCGLAIYIERVFACDLNWQIAGLYAFKDAVDVGRRLPLLFYLNFD
jgi:hypothetical protein